MAIEQKPCPICGKVDCKRYGNVIVGGEINLKTGEHTECEPIDCTITACQIKKIREETGKDVYLV